MGTAISVPLSSPVVSRLCAGDEIVLTGRVLLLSCGEAVEVDPGVGWSPETADGGVCCFVAAGDGGRWQVARIDEPLVDRAVRSLLAAGARGFIAVGQCLATASYALRKYGGLFFAVGPNWLAETGTILPPRPRDGDRPPRLVTFVHVDHAALTVAHDAHGRSIEESRSFGGGLV